MTGPDNGLRIRLLGGFLVTAGSRRVDDAEWRLRKTRGLVKLLALAPGHSLHRAQAMDILWPDLDAESASNNLNKAVHTARRALEPDLTPSRPSRYLHLQGELLVLGSSDALWIDAEEFKRLANAALGSFSAGAYEDALALYSGDLLPEDRYEDWAAGPREELQALYLALLLELAKTRERQSDTTGALSALRQVVATDPAYEEAHQAIMRIHARAGFRHRALRQFQRLREALRQELDVDPSPASLQLYEAIETGRFDAGTPGPPAAADRSADAEARPPFVGRDNELETIEETLEAVFSGQGQVLLLAGEAGIGKSRLAAEVSDRFRRRGGTVLAGAAYEQEGRLPYGPFIEAFAPLEAAIAAGGLRAMFGQDAADLGRLPPPLLSSLRTDRQRMFDEVASLLLERAAAGPILLFLDDLHAADEASLQLLHFLARAARRAPILILGTFRAEEARPASPLGQLVSALARERLSTRLDLGRFRQPESDLLVESLLPDAPIDRPVFDAVQNVAAGNPLYAGEVLRSLQESGRLRQADGRWRLQGERVPLPGALVDMLIGRLDQLGQVPGQILSTAAVIGSDASFKLLRSLSQLPDDELLNALDVCLAAGALRETPAGYQFGHPLQRLAIYDRLSAARRTSMHGRVAAILEAGGERPEVLAHHWSLSEEPHRAVEYLLEAGNRAAAMFANEEAVAAYQQALELQQLPGGPAPDPQMTSELWEKLGDLRSLIGAPPEDGRSYRGAIEALAATADPSRLARLHRKAAYAALSRHDVDTAGADLDAAEAILGGNEDEIECGWVRLVRAIWFWETGKLAEGQQAAEESLALARRHSDGLGMINAYSTLALVFHSNGEWKEGFQLEIEHLGQAADVNPEVGLLFDAHMCLGEYHLYGDVSFESVERYANSMLEQATRQGARRAQSVAWQLIGTAQLLRGAWQEAERCLERSAALSSEVSSKAGHAFALQRLAELSVYRGDFRSAGKYLDSVAELGVGPPMLAHVLCRVLATAALNAIEQGDAQTAGDLLDQAEERTIRSGNCATCGALLHPVAVETFIALGDIERAEEHAASATEVGALWQSGTWRAMAEAAQAAVHSAKHRPGEAADLYLAAATTFERTGQRFDAARCLLRAGQARAECGDKDAARGLAVRAIDTFQSLAAATAEDRARQLLVRL